MRKVSLEGGRHGVERQLKRCQLRLRSDLLITGSAFSASLVNVARSHGGHSKVTLTVTFLPSRRMAISKTSPFL